MSNIASPFDDLEETEVALRTISVAMAAAYAAWRCSSSCAVHPQARYLVCVLERFMTGQAARYGTVADLLAVVATSQARLPREPMLDFAAACSAGLNDFLSGRRTGIQIVFPRGSLDLWNDVQRESALMRIFADRARDAVLQLVRPGWRLLEIGGGTGAATDAILRDRRGACLASYVFTDVSATFVAKAIEKGRGRQGFSAKLFDIDKPAGPQGLNAGAYDLLLAVNVLHVSADPVRALRGLRRLLASGGTLVLCEGAPPSDGVWGAEALFAFLPQWAARPDQRNRVSGFYDWTTWRSWCASAGFEVEPRSSSSMYDERGGVILAQAHA